MSGLDDAASMKTQLRRIAEELATVIGRHEEIVHGGEWCMEERANACAFLAHRLGVRDADALAIFAERLALYELVHEHEHP